jgi:hypothetical protein
VENDLDTSVVQHAFLATPDSEASALLLIGARALGRVLVSPGRNLPRREIGGEPHFERGSVASAPARARPPTEGQR